MKKARRPQLGGKQPDRDVLGVGEPESGLDVRGRSTDLWQPTYSRSQEVSTTHEFFRGAS